MSTEEALALTAPTSVELDESDLSELRKELIDSMINRGAMVKDLRLPRSARDTYRSKIEKIHRLYLKLGGTFTIKELLS